MDHASAPARRAGQKGGGMFFLVLLGFVALLFVEFLYWLNGDM